MAGHTVLAASALVLLGWANAASGQESTGRREHLINPDAPTELQHIEPEDRCGLQGVPRSNLREGKVRIHSHSER